MKKIIFVLLMSSAMSGYAQVKTLRFYHLTVENGLPKRSPTAAMQDRYGYIWAGTSAGLVRYDGYEVKVYLTNLGIGFLSGITDIYQDHEGKLWVGTAYKGLFRYDRSGDAFRQCVYFPSDSGANNIVSIQEDSVGNVWSISRNSTKFFLNCFHKKTGRWQHFSHFDSGKYHIDATDFYSLAEDYAGHIWMASNNGLYGYDSATNHFTNYVVPGKTGLHHIGENIFYALPSQPAILWMDDYIGHYTAGKVNFYPNGLICFDTKDHTFKTYQYTSSDTSSLNSNYVFAALEDKEKRLWIGMEKGISLFNGQTGKFTNYPVTSINANGPKWCTLTEDSVGNLWYSNFNNGLFYFDTKDKTFKKYPANPDDPEALQTDDILSLFTDKTGNLWTTELSEGLQWINKEASLFTVYLHTGTDKSNYSYGKVNDYAEDAAGNIWLGTNNGLIYWNRHTNSFKPLKIGDSDNDKSHHSISCVTIDKRGMIWYVDGNYGLFRYNPVNRQFKHFLIDSSALNADDRITCIYEDRKGKIWVGTSSKGLCSIDPGTFKITQFPFTPWYSRILPGSNKKELSSAVVYDIYEDSKGTLWVGTLRGLNRFNRADGTFTVYFNLPKGFTRIRTIQEDKNGLLWIGTWEGGLFNFNPKTGSLKQFTEKDGLLFNAVYSCLQDSSGMLWLTSPRGMTLFNPNTMAMHSFDAASGLSAHVDYGGFKTREGDFLVSTSDGFMKFNPEKYHPDIDPPIVHIESVSFTKPQTGNNTSEDSVLLVFGHNQFDMRYNENRLTFHYLGIHYQNAATTQYAYKLDGYDKNWIKAGTERSVAYNNLLPGTYYFQVKAANSDGVWSKKIASIAITIHPPWWQTWWAYLMYFILFIVGLWSFIAYRSRKLKKANRILEEKVSHRTVELEESLRNLKATQSQLIQQEKMASLGELTAGIAHEIQNPLNFVNNFSDVNKELLEELKEEADKGNIDEVKTIATDVIANEQKINHHGKRADAIVKGMLQHSRQSSGKKEATDINALCDEYLRLSYHGMRAKDKSFEANFKTDFDPAIGKINIVGQDIGRVLLNLFNNAFYACAERSRSGVGKRQEEQGKEYEPTVSVTTKKSANSVLITVRDNGDGIPKSIKEKIFQPFFTTKPTGSGTGLGLSLSYDIVKAHGGEIKVESEEGEGTTFTILLPA